MNLRKLIFTECDAYKAGKKITPKGVMVHSTGANNPNLKRYVGPDDGLLGENKYGNHWNRPNVGASVHAFIGKLNDGSIATYQVLPWNYRAGHCASGKNGSANNTHIAFEICEDGLSDPVYFGKVYQEAVEFTAYLCKEYNLDPMADGVVICHSEGHKRGIASNHSDVMHWFPKHGKSMDTFRADVKTLLDADKKTEPTSKSDYTLGMRYLKKGCKGEDVRALQILLIGRGFSCGNAGADGSFGSATDSAVRAFQKANNLGVDGVVDEATMGCLLSVS